ncbi:hypothetical protein F4604DRAFT_1957191 [Suillus subluteus]|nr:hypothetical protein F4604DRAFT_1957191 [Suillus subluteus]
MQPAATGDDLNSNDFPNLNLYYRDDEEAHRGHYIDPYINPYFLQHCDCDPSQLGTYHDTLPHHNVEPHELPYPSMPLYHHDPDANPILLSLLPLLQPNLSDYHPSFSLPVMPMDGSFMLPSTADDQSTVTAKKWMPKNFVMISKQRVSSLKPLVLNEVPYIHSVATGSSLPSRSRSSLMAASGPSLMAAVIVLPPMLYDKRNLVHQKIVEAVQQHVLDHTINVCSMLCNLDINQLVRETLGKAASSYCHNQKFSGNWATTNLEVSFTRLSAPFELIMATCKTLAQSKVEYWKKVKVKGLVSDHTSPLKYIFRKDEETNKWWLFEQEVVWDIVIGTASILKLQCHIKNLNNLFCTAVAVAHCALMELLNRKMVAIVFSAVSDKHIYDQLMNYINKHITPNKESVKRWKDFKACTITRFEDILN